MEGDPVIDKLMRPVMDALIRNGVRGQARADIYNRAYEAVMNSMVVIDTMREQLSKANARAEAAEQKLSELQDRTRWHDIDDYPCPSHNEKLELAVRDPFDPTIIEVIHGWWIYEDGDYSVTMFFDDHKNEVAPIKYRPLPEPPEVKMTNDEIRIAIAKVKGLEIPSHPYSLDTQYLPTGGTYPTIYPVPPIPNWPEDIVAAFELVDEILAAGCEVTLSSETRNDNKVWYVTRFDFRADGKGTGYTMVGCQYADTAPLAICAAWLAWKKAQG